MNIEQMREEIITAEYNALKATAADETTNAEIVMGIIITPILAGLSILIATLIATEQASFGAALFIFGLLFVLAMFDKTTRHAAFYGLFGWGFIFAITTAFN